MAVRKASRQGSVEEAPPLVWPFPTYKGKPYTPPKQPRKRVKRPDMSELPEALL